MNFISTTFRSPNGLRRFSGSSLGCTPKGSYDNARLQEGFREGGSRKGCKQKVVRRVRRRCLVVILLRERGFSEGVLRRDLPESDLRRQEHALL